MCESNKRVRDVTGVIRHTETLHRRHHVMKNRAVVGSDDVGKGGAYRRDNSHTLSFSLTPTLILSHSLSPCYRQKLQQLKTHPPNCRKEKNQPAHHEHHSATATAAHSTRRRDSHPLLQQPAAAAGVDAESRAARVTVTQLRHCHNY